MKRKKETETNHVFIWRHTGDAKKVFFWSEPHLPRGWHAVWSTPENRGTLVVVHE